MTGKHSVSIHLVHTVLESAGLTGLVSRVSRVWREAVVCDSVPPRVGG